MEAVEANVGAAPAPFVRWAGGKRWLAPRLVDEIMATEPHLYIEPFLGGGAVALALPAQLTKLLVDINPALIEAWTCIQKFPTTLVSHVRFAEQAYRTTC